jgi:hypothetical protein
MLTLSLSVFGAACLTIGAALVRMLESRALRKEARARLRS